MRRLRGLRLEKTRTVFDVIEDEIDELANRAVNAASEIDGEQGEVVAGIANDVSRLHDAVAVLRDRFENPDPDGGSKRNPVAVHRDDQDAEAVSTKSGDE